MDKLFEDGVFIHERFSCECSSPHHLLDVSIELTDDGKRLLFCSLNFYIAGSASLGYRLKQIWRLLRGNEGEMCEFLLRPEDIGELIKLLNKGVVKN